MAPTLNPYIGFVDDARAGMEFYQQVFGGELSVMTFAEMGDEGNDGVMHAHLTTPSGLTLMGSDMPPGDDSPSPAGGNITISLSGVEADELRGYWERLAEGGEVTMPLERQMWGDEFGMLVDRFGTAWMVNIAGERS